MKHSITFFEKEVVREPQLRASLTWHRYWYKDKLTGAATLNNCVLTVCVFLFIVAVVNGGGYVEDWGLASHWFYWSVLPGIISTLVTVIGLKTLDTAGLGPAKTWAVKRFSNLSKDAQAELGGRNGFIKSLEFLSDEELGVIIAKIEDVQKAEDAARATENKLRSQSGDIIAALERIESTRSDYANKLKELS